MTMPAMAPDDRPWDDELAKSEPDWGASVVEPEGKTKSVEVDGSAGVDVGVDWLDDVLELDELGVDELE